MQTYTAYQHAAYLAAIADATNRAASSYYDQHVLEDDERCYVAIDEGDYAWLPTSIVERIVHTVPAGRVDEY